jgi:lysophospholipase L1-like esterase
MNKFFKNILALSIGIIMAFLLIEGILRIHNPFVLRIKGDKIVLPVNKIYTINNTNKNDLKKLDDIVIHTKNSLGFRGDDPPVDFEKHFTLITVGGSTTECSFLSDGKTWTDILGRKLKEDFKKVWINNAGFDGHSTFGHILLMKNYIVNLKPDVVLFLVGANDQGIARLNEFDESVIKDHFVFNSIRGFVKSMANYSEVFALADNLYKQARARLVGITHNVINFEVMKKRGNVNTLSNEQKKAREYLLSKHKNIYSKDYEKRLRSLLRISLNNGIEPVLITQPALMGNFIDDVTGANFSSTVFLWNVLEIYNDVTRRVGSENNVFVIDLAREMPKSSKYYYDYLHYTNEGAEKVAEIIYNNLYSFLTKKYKRYVKKENRHE